MRGAAYSPSRKRKLAILTSTRHSCFRYAAISFYSWKQRQFYIPENEMNTTQNKYFSSFNISEWNKIFLKRLKIQITNLRVLVTKSFIIKCKRNIMWKTLIIQSTLFEVDRFLSSAYAFPGSVQSTKDWRRVLVWGHGSKGLRDLTPLRVIYTARQADGYWRSCVVAGAVKGAGGPHPQAQCNRRGKNEAPQRYRLRHFPPEGPAGGERADTVQDGPREGGHILKFILFPKSPRDL